MQMTVPITLTLARIALIPVLAVVYLLPLPYDHLVVTTLFVLAGITDWLDGFLARRLGQQTSFGAFLDPVADKLIVAVTLVLLVSDRVVLDQVVSHTLFILATAVIVGREIVVSALREWMAEIGKRASVAVSLIGKFKTTIQVLAIAMLLYRQPLGEVPVFLIGEWLLYLAGGITVWSMVTYLRAAWPSLVHGEIAH